MKTAAMVLATETGSGFTSSKYLASFRRSTLLEEVVAEVHQWPVDSVMVVLGPDAELILERAELGDSLRVIDLEWAEGQAASLRVGIDTLYRLDEFDTLVMIHGDQPGSRGDDVLRLLEHNRSSHRPATVPKYRYANGHPVVLGEELWPRLISMEGTASVDQLLASHPDWVDEVWFDRLPVKRVMTPEDLADLDVKRPL